MRHRCGGLDLVPTSPLALALIALSLLALPGRGRGAPETWSLLRVQARGPDQVRDLAARGLDLVRVRRGAYVDLLAREADRLLLEQAGVPYEVLLPDAGAYYAARSRARGPAPQAFGDGSMGGFYTFAEVQAIMDSLLADDPYDILAGPDTLGLSTYGRPILAYVCSDNPEVEEGEPEALYDALTHAREPQGMMAVLYFLEHLHANYGTDPEITYLVDNRRLWFVPVVNPDGYAINESIYVASGSFGFWRKNARDNNENGIIDNGDGVDLNRNFGYMWGYDNIGSSPSPGSEVYRGPAAFSEPETQALRSLAVSRSFVQALNYHTYSDLLIYPFGYNDLETPDSLLYRDVADLMTEVNNYQFGSGLETVGYFTNGDVDDWMYGEQVEKPKVLSMTPEVGNAEDFFYPPPERILPLAQENLRMNLTMAWTAGGYLRRAGEAVPSDSAGDGDGFPDPGEMVELVVPIRNAGITEGVSGVRALLASAPYYPVRVHTGESAFPDLAPGEIADNAESPFVLEIAVPTDSGVVGDLVRLDLTLQGERGEITRDSLEILLGTPEILFADGGEGGFGNFTTNQGWDIYIERAHTGFASFTDSPYENYQGDADNVMELATGLDLSRHDPAYLTFWSSWEIENDFDFAQVEISTDAGSSWQAVAATHTRPGTGFSPAQPAGQPGYDARQLVWLFERVDLTPFTGPGHEDVRFRFALRSDPWAEFDGWYVDDIAVLHYPQGPVGVGSSDPATRWPRAAALGPSYPNPFNPRTTIPFVVPAPGDGRDRAPAAVPVSLAIYSLRGERVRRLIGGPLPPGAHTATWDGRREDGSAAASGVYLCVLRTGGTEIRRQMLLLK